MGIYFCLFSISLLNTCTSNSALKSVLFTNKNLKSNWTNRKDICGNDDVVGRHHFDFCQPNYCTLDNDYPIDVAGEERQILWIDAYVIRSEPIEYIDCYHTKNSTYIADSLSQQTTFKDNNVFQCSRYCVLEKVGKSGSFIFLQNESCYCVSNELVREWTNKTLIEKVQTRSCSLPCPGRKLDRCGADKIYEELDQTNFSVYRFSEDYATQDYGEEIGNTCFGMNTSGHILKMSCHATLGFNCEEKIETAAGLRIYRQCIQFNGNRYDAEKSCFTTEKRYVANQNNCSLKQTVWHGRFVAERIFWNDGELDSTPAPSDAKCLAISVRKGDMTRLLTLSCLESHSALCVKLENDSFDDDLYTNSVTLSDTTMPEDSFDDDLYTKSVTLSDTTMPEGSLDIKPASPSLGIILGVVAAISAIVITTAIISRKRRKHLIQQNNHQPGPENSHSAVTYSPVKNPAQTYDYSDIGPIGINQIQGDRNEEIYNHLGEAEKNPQNDNSKNIYGHTGLTENEYDLTSTSRIPERNDTTEDLYDHSSDIVS